MTVARRFTATAALVLMALAWPGRAGATARDVVLMLDNSGSMQKHDPEFLSRLAVRTFLEDLGGDVRAAVVIFDQSVRLAMPLTPLDETTRLEFMRSLESVNFKGLLTDSPAALERSIYELKSSGRPGAEKSIVFMTDGIVDTGDKARDLDKARWMREELADEAEEAGIRIYGIAFTEGADFQLMQSLARRTHGDYHRAFTAADIRGVFERIAGALEPSFAEPIPTESLATESVPTESSRPGLSSTGEDPATDGLPPVAAADIPLPEAGATESAGDGTLPALSAPAIAPASLPPLPDAGAATDAVAEPEPLPATERAPVEAEPLPPAGTAPAEPAAAAAEPVDAPTSAVEPPPTEPGGDGPGWTSGMVGAALGGALLLVAAVAAAVALARRRKAPPVPEGPTVPRAFLNDLGEVTTQPSYDLTGVLTVVGRLAGEAHPGTVYVVIDESTVGRRHAIIEYRDHGYWVADQNSLNGTTVNGKRIEGAVQLKHGDRLRFHKHEFEFLMLEMFETDRTMLSDTRFAGAAGPGEGDEATIQRGRGNTVTDPATAPTER